MTKTGLRIDIPGFGVRAIEHIVSDYTGTLSCNGELTSGVREQLLQLVEVIDIHVVTADTYNTAETQLQGIPLKRHKLEGQTGHDIQKRQYGERLGLNKCAVFGNGNNDRLILKAAKESLGLAIAVDNGEGCALDALLSSNIFVVGAVNALRLLIQPNASIATLRF